MEHLIEIILFGFLIASVSVIGLILIKSHEKIAHIIEHNLTELSALSGGIFLVTSYSLIKETLHILPMVNALSAFVGGIILYTILHKVISPHRHYGPEHTHDHDENKPAWKLLIGDTIHNIADGLLLVTSFGAGSTIGISTGISIILHEVPQEISEFFVLRKSGYSNTEAVYLNLASAFSIFVGIGLGLLFLNTGTLQAYLLGITATFFLGIVFTDLFPIHTLLQNKKIGKMTIALVLGALIMFGINSTFNHDHNVDEHIQNIS